MSLLEELKRRNVYRVGIAYLAASWIALQLADVVLENLDVPGWVFRALLAVIVIGFPIALGLAWAYELTPEGVRRDRPSDAPAPAPASLGRYLQPAIIVVLAVAVGYLVVDKLRGEEAAPADATARERSVAVLPFANRSANADDAFFVDGMHDDILTQLAKLATMEKVISQRSVEAYRETAKPIRQIGEELGVAAILTGGFQRAGDNVRINMRLIDARSDETVWAESWDKELTLANLFEIQTEITRDVVSALQGALSEQDRSQLDARFVPDESAYREYVLGRNEMARRTAPALTRALGHYERAVAAAPDFVLAWVGIADVYSLRTDYDDLPLADSFEPRRRAIDRAVALDADSGEALTALAQLRFDQGDKEAAERFFLQAIEQSPNYATAHHWYALLLSKSGRLEEAIARIARARDIDPGAAILAVAESQLLRNSGDLEAADATLVDGIRRNPDFASLYGARSDLFYSRGRIADALRWIDEAVRLSPTSPDVRSIQCLRRAELGALDAAEQCLEALARDFPQQFAMPLTGGHLAVDILRGRIERFLIPVEQALQLPEEARFGMVTGYFLAARYDHARELLGAMRPDLLGTPVPEVEPQDMTLALIASALILDQGRVEDARALITAIEDAYDSAYGQGSGAELTSVMVALGRDDYAGAAAALEASIRRGDIQNWWVFRAPAFADAAAQPEFAAALGKLESEISRQREDYFAMPDLPPI